MTNLINSINSGYQISNAGLKQEEVQATLAKSKQAVSDNFESTTAGKAVTGTASDPKVMQNTMLILPGLALLDKAVEKGISGKGGEGILGSIAKFGDKISNAFHLEKFISEEKSGRFSRFLKNNRFTKYFTQDFQAIPKSSMAKTRSLSQEFFSQMPSELSSLVGSLNSTPEAAEYIAKLRPETQKVFKAMADGADDVIGKLSKEKVMSMADDIIGQGLDINGKIAGLRNKVNAADLKMGKTLFGKLFAKGTLKTKNILTFGGGLISLGFTANAIAQTIKETKEAPKGEKLSTFMHVLSEQYLGMILFQPSISLLYKAGGNKYRGMTPEGRKALADLVTKANTNVDAIKIAQLQQKLLQKGADVTAVKAMTGKSLAEAKKMATAINGGGFIGKLFGFIKSPVATISKLLAPKGEISTQAKDAIKDIAEEAAKKLPTIKEGAKVASLQKDLLIRGVDKAKVAELTGKGIKEARTLAKGLKKEGAKLKFWEKPLKFFGKLLDTGLDTIKSPSATGKVGNKIKGFAGGFARFALIMFVIQPFIQKPITKLINKIFGEPKTYLAKQKAASGEETKNTQSVATNASPATPAVLTNPTSTNLLEQWGATLPKTDTISATGIEKNAVPTQTVNIINNPVQKQQEEIPALNIFNKKQDGNRYIPSIEVQHADNNAQLDAQVDAILKSTESVMRRAKKVL